MKAIRLNAYGGPQVLRVEEAPEPVPGPTDVLIRVIAAGVNPIDEEPPPERKQQRHANPAPQREPHHVADPPAARGAEHQRLHDRQIGPAVEDARSDPGRCPHWPYPGIVIDFSHLCMSHTRNPTSTM